MSATPFEIIDSHLHLQDLVLDTELEAVMTRAASSGVRWMVCNGTRETDWQRVYDLARSHPEIVPCFGMHPWHVATRSSKWMSVLDGFLQKMPSGVGEIGLDRWIENRDEPAQEEVFRAQLDLANDRHRPVVIHCVRAWDWLMKILRQKGPPSIGMMFHAYGGPAKLVRPFAEMGACFSFAGNVLFENRDRMHDALRQVPLDRLLLETDASNLPPAADVRRRALWRQKGRGLNEPDNLPHILQGVAQLLGKTEQQLAEVVWENSLRFFGGILCTTNDSRALKR